MRGVEQCRDFVLPRHKTARKNGFLSALDRHSVHIYHHRVRRTHASPTVSELLIMLQKIILPPPGQAILCVRGLRYNSLSCVVLIP